MIFEGPHEQKQAVMTNLRLVTLTVNFDYRTSLSVTDSRKRWDLAIVTKLQGGGVSFLHDKMGSSVDGS